MRSSHITEIPGSVSTVDMTDGRLKLIVAKDKLKPGERIDVKTPNAVTAVRGTTIITEILRTPTGVTTLLSVLNGFVDVTPSPRSRASRGLRSPASRAR